MNISVNEHKRKYKMNINVNEYKRKYKVKLLIYIYSFSLLKHSIKDIK